MVRILQRQLPWLAGFILTVNLYLMPPLASSPRATDLLGLALGVWIVRRLAGGKQNITALALLALAALLPLGWIVAGFLAGDSPTVTQAARWVIAVPWGLALPVLLTDHDRKRRFAWGLVAGGAVNVAVILLQSVGLESPLRQVGLSSSTAAYHHFVYQAVRMPGLHGHHNASSAVVSLLVPAAFYLYFRRQTSWLTPLSGLIALLLVLHLTSTRGPLLAATATIAYAFLAARAVGRGALVGAVLLAVLAPLITLHGPPGGWNRWRDTQAMEVNFAERLDSVQGAVTLSVNHPLGLGVSRGKELLYDRTGSNATHNAILQAALFLGLPLGLILIVSLPLLMGRGLIGRDGPVFLEGLLACHLLGLFMFEEHLNNPTFVILAVWCVVQALRTTAAGRRPAAGLPGGQTAPAAALKQPPTAG